MSSLAGSNERSGTRLFHFLSKTGSSIQQPRHAEETSSPPQRLPNMTSMTTEVQCLQYARECAQRAKRVSDPQLRERLLDIARTWTERATREPNDAMAPTSADEGAIRNNHH